MGEKQLYMLKDEAYETPLWGVEEYLFYTIQIKSDKSYILYMLQKMDLK